VKASTVNIKNSDTPVFYGLQKTLGPSDPIPSATENWDAYSYSSAYIFLAKHLTGIQAVTLSGTQTGTQVCTPAFYGAGWDQVSVKMKPAFEDDTYVYYKT